MLPGNTPALFKGATTAPPPVGSTVGINDIDPYVRIMLHFDGTTTTIYDHAFGAPSHTFTCVGAATQQTTDRKFGRAAAKFGTTSDYMTTPSNLDYELGAMNWTIDLWIRITNGSVQNAYFGKCNTAINNGYYFYSDADGSLHFAWLPSDGAIISLATALGTITANTWYHIAIERVGTVISLYVNGVLKGTGAITATASIVANASPLTIGRLGDFTAIPNTGQIDEFRMTIGVPRFNGPFNIASLTAPDAPASNGNDGATVLLLHGEGANGSNTFTDSNVGAVAHAATLTGTPTISTTQKKFNTASMRFEAGASDHISYTAALANDLELSYGDFTVDFWVYATAATPATDLISRRLTTASYVPYIFYYTASTGNVTLFVSVNGTSYVVNNVTVGVATLNTWTHFALVRCGSWIYLYRNGTLAFAQNLGLVSFVTTDGFSVGGVNTIGFKGYIDEVRVSRGARWTGLDITLPTSEYTTNVGEDLNTKLLLHFYGVTGVVDIYDHSPAKRGRMIFGGSAQISTVQSKFGTSSLLLNGTTDHLLVDTSSDFEFGAGDWTIDWWEYRTAAATGKCVVARDYTLSFSPFLLGFDSGTGIRQVYMTSNGSSWDIASAKTLGAFTINNWNHCAVTRSGNTFRTFLNGVQQDTWTSAAALFANAGYFSIGRAQNTLYFSGYIDEFRVVKGVAKWTANFTAPTAPYTP